MRKLVKRDFDVAVSGFFCPEDRKYSLLLNCNAFICMFYIIKQSGLTSRKNMV